MRTIRTIALLAVLATTGCMGVLMSLTGHPVAGYGVTEDMARAFGCTVAGIKATIDSLRPTADGPYVVPRVRDSGCDVLAKLGKSDRTETVSSEAGNEVHLWYHTGGGADGTPQTSHLVTLRQVGEREFRVTTVVW
jgi:hypothetical protein